MLPAHLSVTRSHLWIVRHLIHSLWPVSCTSGPGHFAGVHFGLVSTVPLIPLLGLVCVCSGFSCQSVTCSSALTFVFRYVARLVSIFSRSRWSSLALTLR